MQTLFSEWKESSPENRKHLAEEALIIEVSEEIWAALEQAGQSKAQLAQKMSVSKSYMTQVLDGTRNMTLRTLAGIASALDRQVSIRLRPVTWDKGWVPLIEEVCITTTVKPMTSFAVETANDQWQPLEKIA